MLSRPQMKKYLKKLRTFFLKEFVDFDQKIKKTINVNSKKNFIFCDQKQ